MARRVPLVRITELARTVTGTGTEGSAQTYLRGAPLVWSSGTLVEASANPRDIVGFALNDATGTTGTVTVFAKALPHGLLQLEINLDKASGLGTENLLAATHIGNDYGITKDASGIWYVDVDKVTAGTNTCVLVERLIGAAGSDSVNDAATDADPNPGRVLVSIMSEACVTQQAAS